MQIQKMILLSFVSLAILSVTMQDNSTVNRTGRKLLSFQNHGNRGHKWDDAPIKVYPKIQMQTVLSNCRGYVDHWETVFYLGRTGTDQCEASFDYDTTGAIDGSGIELPLPWNMLTKLKIRKDIPKPKGKRKYTLEGLSKMIGGSKKFEIQVIEAANPKTTEQSEITEDDVKRFKKALDDAFGVSFGDIMFTQTTIPDNDTNQVTQGNLFLGSVNAAENQGGFLDKNNITAICSVYELEYDAEKEKEVGLPKYPPNLFQKWLDNPSKIKMVDVKDHMGLDQAAFIENFGGAADQIFDWLEEGENVLLHCQLGQSRSVAVLTVFLIKYRGMTLDEAIKFIQERRRKAQLGTWKKCLVKYYDEKKTVNKNWELVQNELGDHPLLERKPSLCLSS